MVGQLKSEVLAIPTVLHRTIFFITLLIYLITVRSMTTYLIAIIGVIIQVMI
jgi:hypothetical protein